MKQPLVSIGTIEAVSLPDYGIEGVLAKIDTGADSSAIWATNIIDKNGELSFTLFGPTSPYYSGKEIRTKHYSFVTVKNSFGHKEGRYKVDIKLKLGDRLIKARINLANRANSRFPILIGRRTLRGKFMVDVSRRNSLLASQKILLVLAVHSKANEAYVNSLRSEGLNIQPVTYSGLLFCCGGEGNKITIQSSGQDISEFSLVYFRTSRVFGHQEVSGAMAQYLLKRNIDFIDSVVVECANPDKLFQYMVLADNGIRVPMSLFVLPKNMPQYYEKLVADLGLPFVLKDTRGRIGENNYLVNSRSEFDRILRQANDLDVWLIAQQYIPNDYDYRVIVMGGQASLVIKRSRGSGESYLNNVSKGANSELIDVGTLPRSLINQAGMAAKLLKLQIAGVDLVQDKVTKLWYCLEVNKAPHLYRGAFVEQKEAAVAKYLSQRLKN